MGIFVYACALNFYIWQVLTSHSFISITDLSSMRCELPDVSPVLTLQEEEFTYKQLQLQTGF